MLSTTAESIIQSGTYAPLIEPSGLRKPVVFATLSACLGAVSFGYVLGYPSPVEESLKDRLNWSDDQVSWFTSVSSLSAMLGALIGLYFIDRCGRKFNIMMCSFPFVVGWVFIASAKATSLILIGRCITGAAMGAISLTVPLYIAEISPARYRGTLGSANQLGCTVGQLLAYSLGAVLKWRWLAIAGAVPSALMVLLMTAFPESPRWLIKEGRISEACQVLLFFRQTSYEECEEECKEIQSSLETDEPIGLSEFKKPTVYRPFIISVMLMLFQQFGGINTVITYASTILGDAGMQNANVPAIAVTIVQCIGTAVSCVIIDKLGRRILLMFPTALMFISMAVLGASSYFSDFPSSITLISLCLYIIGFAMGLGPIPWLAMSEIFPTNVRGIASGITTQINWLSAFTVIKTYDSMKNSMHPYGCYWFYAAVCLACVLYVFLFLPETKGKTLEEVENLFANHHDLLAPDSLPSGQYNSFK